MDAQYIGENGFREEYFFLSNFYPTKIIYESKVYPTAEHLYASRKAANEKDAEYVRLAETAGEAKHRGREIKCRRDWLPSVKIAVMREVVHLKFSQNDNIMGMLKDTTPLKIVEINWWGDEFFGVCGGKGYNYLGKILMEIRDGFVRL